MISETSRNSLNVFPNIDSCNIGSIVRRCILYIIDIIT